MPGVEEENTIVQKFEVRQALDGTPARRQFAGSEQFRQDFGFVHFLLMRTPCDQPAKVDLKVIDRLSAALDLLRAQDGFERSEDRKRPVAEWLPFALGHPQHVPDQLQRYRGRELANQIDRAALGRAIEQALYQRLDPRLQRLQRTWGKSGRQKLAHTGVVRRIVEYEAGGVVLVQRATPEAGSKVDRL